MDFSGTWHNQHGSEMDLTVEAGGKLSGKYRTGVGAPTPAEQFDLVGFVSGDLIVFSVNFGKYGSMTSWAGQHTLDLGEGVFQTMWHLAINVADPDEPAKMWGAVRSGCDRFRRGPTPAGEIKLFKAPSHPIKAFLRPSEPNRATPSS